MSTTEQTPITDASASATSAAPEQPPTEATAIEANPVPVPIPPPAKAKPSKPKTKAPAKTKAKAPTQVAVKSEPKTTPAKPKGASPKRSPVKAPAFPPLATIRRVSERLKSVSDPTRLIVLGLLESGELHVGALCLEIGGSQPAVSHHLALLRHARLIEPRRSGKQNFYSLTPDGRKLIEAVNAVV